MLMALPLILISLFVGAPGTAHGSVSSRPMQGMSETKSCPMWFEDAPALGPGRPQPVAVSGVAGVTVCRYYGPAGGIHVPSEENPRTNLTAGRTIEDRHTVQSLARAFDRLAPYRHPKSEISLCPNESSGGFYLRFEYANGRESSVRVIPTGCRRVVPGKHGKPLFLPTYLQRRLVAITSTPRR